MALGRRRPSSHLLEGREPQGQEIQFLAEILVHPSFHLVHLPPLEYLLPIYAQDLFEHGDTNSGWPEEPGAVGKQAFKRCRRTRVGKVTAVWSLFLWRHRR